MTSALSKLLDALPPGERRYEEAICVEDDDPDRWAVYLYTDDDADLEAVFDSEAKAAVYVAAVNALPALLGVARAAQEYREAVTASDLSHDKCDCERTYQSAYYEPTDYRDGHYGGCDFNATSRRKRDADEALRSALAELEPR